MAQNPLTIGVFDSGVGGLTVLRALQARLFGAHFLYLGDMARLPYGTKSAQAVTTYTLKAAAALVSKGAQSLVIACSTASSCAIPELEDLYPHIPIIDVITPTVAHVSANGAKDILILATQGTVSSHLYKNLITKVAPHIRVHETATPLLVGLAEEGWRDPYIVSQVLDHYLEGFKYLDTIDTVVLGCTHFPFHLDAIKLYFGSHVNIVDTAIPAAEKALSQWPCVMLEEGSTHYYVTDSPERFRSTAELFLSHTIPSDQVTLIDL